MRQISQDKLSVLRESILQGNRVSVAALKAGVNYWTGYKYFQLWTHDGSIPAGLLCKCGRIYTHPGRCKSARLISLPTQRIHKPTPIQSSAPDNPHHSVAEWNAMIVGVRDELLAFAYRGTDGNRPKAEDLVQKTLEKCLRSRTQFVKGTHFKAWIYRCLKNNMIGDYRARRRQSPLALDDLEHFAPSTIIIRDHSDERVLANEIIVVLARDLPDSREVCFMVWLDGKTYDEAAAALNISIGTVKSRLWRARKKVLRILGETEAGDGEEAEMDVVG